MIKGQIYHFIGGNIMAVVSFYGFDPGRTRDLLMSSKTLYSSFTQELYRCVQHEFVEGMSDKWACSEAQEFFNDSFKPAIDSLFKGITEVFSSIFQTVNSAGEVWNATVSEGKSIYTKVPFEENTPTVDVSAIQENINGIRGIDMMDAVSVANKLQNMRTIANDKLGQLRSFVSEEAFIGGEQQANLLSSILTIQNKISNATAELGEQTETLIGNTVAKYENTAGKIASAFKVQS